MYFYYYFLSDETSNEDCSTKSANQGGKLNYVKNVKLFLSSSFVVADQFFDIFLITYLFIWKEFWFAAIFLFVDVLPAACIIWHKLKYVLMNLN